MDRTATDAAIRVFLREVQLRLEKSLGIARAAEACAEAGQFEQAVEIALDIEQPISESARLLDAICLLNRLAPE